MPVAFTLVPGQSPNRKLAVLRFWFVLGIARVAGMLIMLLPHAAFAVDVLAAAAVVSAEPGAATVSRLVLRLSPEARPADGAPLGSAMLADLQRTLGARLTGATATAAGNQVVELADPVDAATARHFANALRLRGDVVWAEIERGTGVLAATTRTAAVAGTGNPSVRRLIVTFADPFGNERDSGYETTLGYTIVSDGAGVWWYALLDASGHLAASGQKVGSAAPSGLTPHLRNRSSSAATGSSIVPQGKTGPDKRTLALKKSSSFWPPSLIVAPSVPLQPIGRRFILARPTASRATTKRYPTISCTSSRQRKHTARPTMA